MRPLEFVARGRALQGGTSAGWMRGCACLTQQGIMWRAIRGPGVDGVGYKCRKRGGACSLDNVRLCRRAVAFLLFRARLQLPAAPNSPIKRKDRWRAAHGCAPMFWGGPRGPKARERRGRAREAAVGVVARAAGGRAATTINNKTPLAALSLVGGGADHYSGSSRGRDSSPGHLGDRGREHSRTPPRPLSGQGGGARTEDGRRRPRGTTGRVEPKRGGEKKRTRSMASGRRGEGGSEQQK